MELLLSLGLAWPVLGKHLNFILPAMNGRQQRLSYTSWETQPRVLGLGMGLGCQDGIRIGSPSEEDAGRLKEESAEGEY